MRFESLWAHIFSYKELNIYDLKVCILTFYKINKYGLKKELVEGEMVSIVRPPIDWRVRVCESKGCSLQEGL